MTIINKKTGERLTITGVDTRGGLFYAAYKAHSKAKPELKSFVFQSDSNLQDWMTVFAEWLLTKSEYADWVSDTNFVDWPTDAEMPEHDMNYRLYLTEKQIAKLAATKSGLQVIGKFHAEQDPDSPYPMQQRNIGEDKYIYMTQIPSGDAFYIMFLLGGLDANERAKVQAQFNKNPYKPEVPDIDFEPSAEMLAYIESLTPPPVAPENENPPIPEEGEVTNE